MSKDICDVKACEGFVVLFLRIVSAKGIFFSFYLHYSTERYLSFILTVRPLRPITASCHDR